MENRPLHFVFIIGCTGCGKGALGFELAQRLDAEIISVDSMKVYRGMDVGTAKPSPERLKTVRHHMIDVVDPWETFSMARFLEQAEAAAGDIAARGKTILAVGGTGMYLKGLSEGIFDGPGADATLRDRLKARADTEGWATLHGELAKIDPEAGLRIHPNDQRRIVRALEVYELTGKPITTLQEQWERGRTKHRCTFIGLRRELADQNHRTNMRVKALIERGWVAEVERLLASGRPLSTSAAQAMGYREIIEHVGGWLPLEEAAEKIKIATRQFAKSQRTWFKRFHATHWYDLSPDDTAAALADRVLGDWDELCK